ncbi:glycosyltransferase family 4 protein [Candidatus Viridilinea mediisalina]|uniref:Glycosyl transferase family 1 n=1 Tax=Candidatus Viridilinea mediisalina TaxID=2024553 RepID=A0A2A6RG68_9CHLR|nr:glycosyltransferase family 4 protein [Candidatus Viridilinea mediisalina]PDW01886.1 glycosyl transferase family 1 [Candidatus Viridilinea mediisalina]
MINQKRIVICTAQVPFVRGGAEYLVEGLRDALRAAGHQVDVVALPFQWEPLERIAESALSWRLLDLTHANGVPVDLVISTKFPSYLVRHPNKVVWLVHQHRQAYDWYGTPLSDFVNIPEHRQIREAIFRMDRLGLEECQARFTISRNVSERLRRFNGLTSTPLYPPSRYADQLWAGSYGPYVFSSARLDRAKRLDLLLHAAAHMHHPVPIFLAGSGPERERLELLASELGLTTRVRFLGFVSDSELLELYAGARAVYYAPVDEDYGFATVEAFGAARPVVTTHDAGGVLEFVLDATNGFVCPPEAAPLAQALDRLCSDARLAERLGRAGQPLVASISWERVVEGLVG